MEDSKTKRQLKSVTDFFYLLSWQADREPPVLFSSQSPSFLSHLVMELTQMQILAWLGG